jgi:hypothetical protein
MARIWSAHRCDRCGLTGLAVGDAALPPGWEAAAVGDARRDLCANCAAKVSRALTDPPSTGTITI